MSQPVRHEFKQRKLRRLSRKYVPSVWLFMDVETKPTDTPEGQLHRFWLGWTCLLVRTAPGHADRESWKYHASCDGLLSYLHAAIIKSGDVMLCGHNIFFDLQASGFFRYFTAAGWQLKFLYDRGLTYIIKIEYEGARCTIVSSTNWFATSLEKLGQMLGHPKGKVDFITGTKAEIKAYCRRDVEITVKALQYYIDFITHHDLGKFSLTKSSQAFTAFRHRFMNHEIYMHKDPDVTDLERSAYAGGRTECFHIGDISGGPFVSLDINSMYGYVMKVFNYPYRLVEYDSRPDMDRIKGVLNKYAVIAEVDIYTDVPAYAVKMHGKTIFPVGRFTTSLCSTGLRYGLDRGHITAINRAAIYRQADLFSGYVDFFHTLKSDYKDGDLPVMEKLCKYFLNSLYGKFGQRKIITEMLIPVEDHDYLREEVYDFVTKTTVMRTYIMNRLLIQYGQDEGDLVNVAIAAHITENARFVLWNLIESTGMDRVLYCDTDSIKLRKRDLKRVIFPMSDTRLGALKIEDTSKQLTLEGPKNYRTEKTRKIKGIPLKAVELSPGVFEYDHFRRQTSHLREGVSEGFIVTRARKKIKGAYDKGTVLPGGRVTPFVL